MKNIVGGDRLGLHVHKTLCKIDWLSINAGVGYTKKFFD